MTRRSKYRDNVEEQRAGPGGRRRLQAIEALEARAQLRIGAGDGDPAAPRLQPGRSRGDGEHERNKGQHQAKREHRRHGHALGFGRSVPGARLARRYCGPFAPIVEKSLTRAKDCGRETKPRARPLPPRGLFEGGRDGIPPADGGSGAGPVGERRARRGPATRPHDGDQLYGDDRHRLAADAAEAQPNGAAGESARGGRRRPARLDGALRSAAQYRRGYSGDQALQIHAGAEPGGDRRSDQDEGGRHHPAVKAFGLSPAVILRCSRSEPRRTAAARARSFSCWSRSSFEARHFAPRTSGRRHSVVSLTSLFTVAGRTSRYGPMKKASPEPSPNSRSCALIIARMASMQASIATTISSFTSPASSCL